MPPIFLRIYYTTLLDGYRISVKPHPGGHGVYEVSYWKKQGRKNPREKRFYIGTIGGSSTDVKRAEFSELVRRSVERT
jgi:hypothetical protein